MSKLDFQCHPSHQQRQSVVRLAGQKPETLADNNREVAVSHQSHQELPGGSNGMRCGVATAFGGSTGG
jgi:hypothetical protein